MSTLIDSNKQRVTLAWARLSKQLRACGFVKTKGSVYRETAETISVLCAHKELGGIRLMIRFGITLKAMLPHGEVFNFNSMWEAKYWHIRGIATYWSDEAQRWLAPVYNPANTPIVNAWDKYTLREYVSVADDEVFATCVLDRCVPCITRLDSHASIREAYFAQQLRPFLKTLDCASFLKLA